MAIRFEKIQQGQTYYQRKRERMGNTTMTTLGEWPVYIKELDRETRKAVVIWNHNSTRPQTWYGRELEKLFDWSMYDDCAEVTRGVWGRVVKVTKKKAPKGGKRATP